MKRLLAGVLLMISLTLAGCGGPIDLIASQAKIKEPPADYSVEVSGFRYVRSTLTPQEQAVYDQLAAGLLRQDETIEDLYPDPEMIQKVLTAIDRDYPEYFWFAGSGKIETSMLSGRPIKALYRPNYTMDQTQRSQVQARINAWEDQCMSQLPPGASDYETALHVYRYIIDHADYQTVEDNSIVHIMVDGRGLCGCYAKTAQYLLNRRGIDCAYICGVSSQNAGESHAWNLIWPDGVPCWMDVTWGDPVFDGGDPNDGPAFEYFGITTADLLRNHILDGDVPVPDCVSEDYNYFRRSGLYFEAYDEGAIRTAMTDTLASGENRICLRFSDTAWPEATHLLLDQGQIHRLLREAAEQAGTGAPSDSLWYSRNDAFCTLTVKVS